MQISPGFQGIAEADCSLTCVIQGYERATRNADFRSIEFVGGAALRSRPPGRGRLNPGTKRHPKSGTARAGAERSMDGFIRREYPSFQKAREM